jgi:small conductance mechanosensitive channel
LYNITAAVLTAFIFVLTAPAVFAETARAKEEAKPAFYSVRPSDDAGIFNEISRHIDSLTIQTKNLNDFLDCLNSQIKASSSEEILIYSKENVPKFKGVLNKYIKLKKDFELLYRDYVSIKVKNEIIKTEQSVKNENVIEFDFKNANLVDISYEITLLDSVLTAKRHEMTALDSEIASFSSIQDELINAIAIADKTRSISGESLEIILDAPIKIHDITKFSGNIDFVFKSVEDFYNNIFSRFLELKLFCIGQQKKIINYEISTTRSELEVKKQVNSFIKDNSALLSSNKSLSAGLSSEEIEISRINIAESKPGLDDSLKKIKSIMEEIKKEKNASDDKIKSAQKLKYLNLSLQLEQELLKHKSSLSNETDELSKFLVRIADYSAKAVDEETDNIQKLYYFTNASSLYDKKNLIKEEIHDYKKQREEAISLSNLIKSGRVKIENQLQVLNSDLILRESESAEIALQIKLGPLDKEFKNFKETMGAMIQVIKNRVTLNQQHVQSAAKYEEWLKEKIKTIDNSVKILSTMVNQLEERLDFKTLSEAFSSLNNIGRSIYYKIEKTPFYIWHSLFSKEKWLDFFLFIKILALLLIMSFLSYKILISLFLKNSESSYIALSFKQILPYILFAVSVKIFAVSFLQNSALINIFVLSALIFSAAKIVLIALNNLSLNKSLDSDIYFRLSLFIKYLFFSTIALIIIDNASQSTHLIILSKFLYKVFGLILLILLTKKYSPALLSCLYISRRQLKLKKYSYSIFHLAALYNHLLRKYHTLITLIFFAAAVVYFAGYYQHSFYIINSSFLTLILYSVFFLVSKYSMMTFEWLFSEESALLNLKTYNKFKLRAIAYIKIIYKLFFLVFFAFFTLKIWGIRVNYIVELITADLTLYVGKKVLLIVAVIVTGFLVWHLIEKIIEDFFKSALSHQKSDNIKKRGATIAPLIKSTAKYIIWFLGIYLVLKEIGVDVTPIVAGASIFALAIGFGAQNLVKDIVAGFFIIFEDQYNVGDYVTIEGISGTIEEISVRITKIRDLVGTLHIIPNGAITRTSNFSKDYSISRFEVSVAYESDFDKAIAVIEKTASGLCMDWNLFIIEPTKMLGIVTLGESEVVIRTQTKLSVGKRVDFECELRKRLLKQFRENNIEIPYKRLVVISENES